MRNAPPVHQLGTVGGHLFDEATHQHHQAVLEAHGPVVGTPPILWTQAFERTQGQAVEHGQHPVELVEGWIGHPDRLNPARAVP